MKFDVLVVGAGLAGAALAAALRGSNLKVGIVEARPPARPAASVRRPGEHSRLPPDRRALAIR